MAIHGVLRALAAAGIALLAAGTTLAQGPAQEYAPEVGQDGKDVVWVPTADTLVARMLDLAKVGPGDYLIDLGSGDGRTVIAAAKRGAKALGIEFNARMVALARRRAEQAGVADKATFVEGDIFKTDFSEATVLTLFLLPELNQRLRPAILAMKPGTRVVSNSFPMGDWRPDLTAAVTQDCKTYCRALMWTVPAKVEGYWLVQYHLTRGSVSVALKLEQVHQYFNGALVGMHLHLPVKGRLDGTAIAFDGSSAYHGTGESLRIEFKGEVKGDPMEGSYLFPDKQLSGTWSATWKKGL